MYVCLCVGVKVFLHLTCVSVLGYIGFEIIPVVVLIFYSMSGETSAVREV